ncbi:SCO4225 family membrane protein [Streptomyces sp. DT171]|uniref:SCO4225 family membrane protein n=2 Tax=unclassified Streptomyces TaxID=2593676 RepID=UPI003CEE1C6D
MNQSAGNERNGAGHGTGSRNGNATRGQGRSGHGTNGHGTSGRGTSGRSAGGRRLRTLVRLTFANPASMIYLGIVLATAGFVTVDTLFVHHEDASFAGVWLFFLAAPTVFVFLVGSSLGGAESGGPTWFLLLGLTVSVLVQSLAIGWFVRLLTGGHRNRSTAARGA